MNTVSLPWPPSCLSPNARKDRRAISGVRKKYRADCWALAKEAKLTAGAHVDLQFFPPDRRKRDLDNMLASVKSGLDGVAQALGVDDSTWSLSIRRGDPVAKGAVILTVKETA